MVYKVYQQNQPAITRIARKKQVSLNEESEWAKARNMWVKHLLIWFGVHLVSDFWTNVADVPADFTDAVVGGKMLSLQQVAFCDETHKIVHVGKHGGYDGYEIQFKKGAQGKIDANGEYNERGTCLQMKYRDEVHFCLVVAQVFDNEKQEVVGRHLPPFDYSAKVLLLLKDYNKK